MRITYQVNELLPPYSTVSPPLSRAGPSLSVLFEVTNCAFEKFVFRSRDSSLDSGNEPGVQTRHDLPGKFKTRPNGKENTSISRQRRSRPRTGEKEHFSGRNKDVFSSQRATEDFETEKK